MTEFSPMYNLRQVKEKIERELEMTCEVIDTLFEQKASRYRRGKRDLIA